MPQHNLSLRYIKPKENTVIIKKTNYLNVYKFRQICTDTPTPNKTCSCFSSSIYVY